VRAGVLERLELERVLVKNGVAASSDQIRRIVDVHTSDGRVDYIALIRDLEQQSEAVRTPIRLQQINQQTI
jgi:hypothetical protein